MTHTLTLSHTNTNTLPYMLKIVCILYLDAFSDSTKTKFKCKFKVCLYYLYILANRDEAIEQRARSLPHKGTANYSYSAGLDPQASLLQTTPQNADLGVKPSVGYVKHLHRVTSIELHLLWGSADSRDGRVGPQLPVGG